MQYPLVELASAGIFAGIAFTYPPITSPPMLLRLLSMLLFSAAALSIVVADARYQLIPDGAVFIVGLAALLRIISNPTIALSHSVSALGAFGMFYFLWWITKQKGMGFGDVKLAGILGLFLGFPDILLAIYCAFLTGAIVGVILMIAQKAGMKTKIAFGPFLIAGALISVYFGQPIYTWIGTML